MTDGLSAGPRSLGARRGGGGATAAAASRSTALVSLSSSTQRPARQRRRAARVVSLNPGVNGSKGTLGASAPRVLTASRQGPARAPGAPGGACLGGRRTRWSSRGTQPTAAARTRRARRR